jgi:2'-phosphotransferase
MSNRDGGGRNYQGRGGGGRGGRGRGQNQSSNVKLSKTLSYVLRHGAEKEGFEISPDGFISISALLSSPKFSKVTLEQIEDVVKNCPKQRFSLLKSDNGEQWIRANQGHSLSSVER